MNTTTMLRGLMLGLVLAAGSVDAGDRDSVFGQWAGDTSILDIGEANGTLYARVVGILNPNYGADEKDGPAGTPRVDAHNPDESLRDRPILGINLLSGYQFSDGKWQGQLYDPESGKTYQSQISVDGDGNLILRGYIGTPMLGKTRIFKPASTCSADIKRMLAQADIANTCG